MVENLVGVHLRKKIGVCDIVREGVVRVCEGLNQR